MVRFRLRFQHPISHSVSAATIRQPTETGVSDLMEDIRHLMGLHTSRRETNLELKPQWTLVHNHNVICAEYGDGRRARS